MEATTATNRTRVIRHPERGVYDTEQIYSILDEGYVCHVGFAVDGQPYVLPTAYGRSGDLLYIHGSAASRMLRSLAQGVAVCVTVTLVDGFVLARAAFRHSMNYRSVVILGAARPVTDPGEKWQRFVASPTTWCRIAGKKCGRRMRLTCGVPASWPCPSTKH